MMNKYELWISEFVDGDGKYHCCKHACDMDDYFPELKAVSGWFIDCNGNHHQHWWCEDENGKIIDPTRKQFEDGECSYRKINEIRPERFNKCPNCGELFMPEETNTRTICSELCAREYVAYIKGCGI